MRCPFEGLDECTRDYNKRHYSMSSLGLAEHLFRKHPDRIKFPVSFLFHSTNLNPVGIKTDTYLLDGNQEKICKMSHGWNPWEMIK